MKAQTDFSFSVRGYECGPDSLATLAAVMNYLQEAAGLQAEASGFSKLDFNASGEDLSWVITRLHLRVERYPRWHESVRVSTWPSGGRKIIATRDFEMFSGDERICTATSEWVLMNLATRRIVPVPQSVYDASDAARPRAMGPAHEFSRLRWERREFSPEAVRLRARRGDIDLNGHVNNVRYVEWLSEALPADAGKAGEFEIAFKSETMAGDEVVVEAAETGPGVYALRAASADGRDHVVARFAAASAASRP